MSPLVEICQNGALSCILLYGLNLNLASCSESKNLALNLVRIFDSELRNEFFKRLP